MFSRFLVEPVQEMTCEVPAQSVTQSCPISTGAKVVTVSCGVFTLLPSLSAARTDYFASVVVEAINEGLIRWQDIKNQSGQKFKTKKETII